MSSRVAFLNQQLKRCLVLVNVVGGSHNLPHSVRNLGDIGTSISLFNGKNTMPLGRRIQWYELQRREVLNNKVPRSVFINLIQSREDTLGIVRDRLASYLRVLQKAINTQIIGADPDRIHRLCRWDVQEWMTAVGNLAIGQVRGHFIFKHRWEIVVDGAIPVRRDLVRAYRA
ncbi:hypothetical protein O181_095998 [Austropuccinia psidii MF-1]|uniref:Uncharacterized protein n=1 Tax=Austropuccinia psidii MF-1 TaxID=1389203 RepID=A0A9Q3J4X1_9BASI|nr:hypothetical protein [Austropuccinia psidii MF-1]